MLASWKTRPSLRSANRNPDEGAGLRRKGLWRANTLSSSFRFSQRPRLSRGVVECAPLRGVLRGIGRDTCVNGSVAEGETPLAVEGGLSRRRQLPRAGLDDDLGRARAVAVAGGGDLLRAARHAAPGGAIVVGGDPGSSPLLVDRPLVDGVPTAYVCRGFVCDRPVTSVPDLLDVLAAS